MKLILFFYMGLGMITAGGLASPEGLHGEDLWAALIGSFLFGGLFLLGIFHTKAGMKFLGLKRAYWIIAVAVSYGLGCYFGIEYC